MSWRKPTIDDEKIGGFSDFNRANLVVPSDRCRWIDRHHLDEQLIERTLGHATVRVSVPRRQLRYQDATFAQQPRVAQRRLIDLETHRAVFTWVQVRLVEAGLLKGQTVAIDATTLEANAAMRSIVRRDTGERYQEFLTGLAKASGIDTPTREDLARLDRKRKKKTSNKDWTHPRDPDARVTKMKDGRTHLAHKAEHAVDLETGAIVTVTVQGADQGDTTTIEDTLAAAVDQLHAVATAGDAPVETAPEIRRRQGVSQPPHGSWTSRHTASAPTSANRTVGRSRGSIKPTPATPCMPIDAGSEADGAGV